MSDDVKDGAGDLASNMQRALGHYLGESSLPAVLDRVMAPADEAGARMSHQIREDLGVVTRMDISSDEQRLAACSGPLAMVWNMETEAIVRRIHLPGMRVLDVALDYAGDVVALATDEGTVHLWDVRRGEELWCDQQQEPVHDVFIPEMGNVVATANAAGQACVYRLADAELLRCFQHETDDLRIFVDQEGEHLLTEDDEGVHLWSLRRGEVIRRFEYAAPLEDEDELYSGHYVGGSHGRNVYIWDRTSGACLRVFRHRAYVVSLDVCAGGRKLATLANGTVTVWDVMKRREIAQFYTYLSGECEIKFAAGGRQVLVCGNDSSILCYDVETASPVKSFFGDHVPIIAAAITRDEDWFCVGGQSGAVIGYDFTTGRRQRTLKGHAGAVSALAMTPDGRLLASGGHDGTVQVWERESGRRLLCFDLSGGPVQAVALSQRGDAVLAGNYLGHVVELEIDSGKLCVDWSVHRGAVRSLSFSADETTVLSASDDGGVVVFDRHSGDVVHRFDHPGGVYPCRYDSTEQTLFAGCTAGVIYRWRLADNSRLAHYGGHHFPVRSLWVSEDTTRLASLDWGGEFRLWDVDSERCIGGASVPDPRRQRYVWMNTSLSRLLTVGADGMARVWDAETFEQLGRLHILQEGFLWEAYADVSGEDDWLWTDREDLVWVLQQASAAGSPSLPDADDQREYLATHNSMSEVLTRLGLAGQGRFSALEDLKEKQRNLLGVDSVTALLEQQ